MVSEKRKARSHDYYTKNSSEFAEKARKWRLENAQYVTEYRSSRSAIANAMAKDFREGLLGPFTPKNLVGKGGPSRPSFYELRETRIQAAIEDPTWVGKNRQLFLERKHEAESTRKWRTALESFKIYGDTKCYCCNESNPAFLTLDHINGGGNVHRREIRERSYIWAKQNGWPPVFRVACFNCNCAANRNDGRCPHQKD